MKTSKNSASEFGLKVFMLDKKKSMEREWGVPIPNLIDDETWTLRTMENI